VKVPSDDEMILVTAEQVVALTKEVEEQRDRLVKLGEVVVRLAKEVERQQGQIGKLVDIVTRLAVAAEERTNVLEVIIDPSLAADVCPCPKCTQRRKENVS
jgi:intein/homing endonuclease